MRSRRLRGAKALGGALEAGRTPGLVLVHEACDGAETRRVVEAARRAGSRVERVSARELARMDDSPTGSAEPLEVLAMEAAAPAAGLEELMQSPGPVWLLDRLRYPGNVGFVLRAVEVAGCAGAVVETDFDETRFEEALRLGMRPQRFMPVLRAPLAEAIRFARAAHRPVIAIETSGDSMPWQVDLSGDPAFLIGGERHGVAAAHLALADDVLRLPSAGFIPSYNVQAATAIVLGEWLRQNTPHPRTRTD